MYIFSFPVGSIYAYLYVRPLARSQLDVNLLTYRTEIQVSSFDFVQTNYTYAK